MTTDKISPDFSVKEWVLCFFKPFEIKRRKRKISRPKEKGGGTIAICERKFPLGKVSQTCSAKRKECCDSEKLRKSTIL